jgi:hypothetical protein
MFTVYLFVIALTGPPEFEPVYLDRFKTMEACQAAAGRYSVELKEKLDKHAEVGAKVVCAELKGPAKQEK